MTSDKTPRKKKLRVRKKEKTRQAILAAAEEFFSKKPMNEVSLEEIAEAAFVSRTTLYNYFQNKDAIFFGLGIENIEDLINQYEENYSDDLSGFEQVIQLCKISFSADEHNPLTHAIFQEFFKRIQYHNISLNELHGKIKKAQLSDAKYGLRTPQYEALLENSEEPYLIEFYIRLERNSVLWINAVKKGKADGTITNDLNADQIVEFMYMLLMGIEDEMKLRESTLDRIGLDITTINEHIFKLVASFLRKS
ncbi:MAG: TetR/AcrR family transcriptional regulator [Candidatus Thorarchaeota archaeon]